jgi:hypothetical protein
VTHALRSEAKRADEVFSDDRERCDGAIVETRFGDYGPP